MAIDETVKKENAKTDGLEAIREIARNSDIPHVGGTITLFSIAIGGYIGLALSDPEFYTRLSKVLEYLPKMMF